MKFKKGEQTKLLRSLKEEAGLSWTKVAKTLQVGRSMVFLYLSEKCKIPKFRIEKLCAQANMPIGNNFEFIEETINEEKQIREPPLDEELSEFLGILSGDGCLGANNYDVSITCGAMLDDPYIRKNVAPLFEKLFNTKPNIRIERGTIHCRVYSKNLWKYLRDKFGFPISEKKGKLKIPLEIMRNEKLLCCFLRGVFDTDGGIHRHHKKSAMIQITSYSNKFRTQLLDSLKVLGFHPSESGNDLYVCDNKCITDFFKRVGSNNPRNVIRYKKYKECGVVPLQKELAGLIGAITIC